MQLFYPQGNSTYGIMVIIIFITPSGSVYVYYIQSIGGSTYITSRTQYNTRTMHSTTHRRQTVTHSSRGGVRGMRGLGPNITARGQSIGISIGMLDKH
jgi:hypothetical protein